MSHRTLLFVCSNSEGGFGMVAKEDLLLLKTKILPAGAETVLDYLASRHQQVELTQIVLENVPLVIIGRHGMIARVPVNGVVHKVSQAQEIVDLLQSFFQRQEKLYLFVNLPDIPLPKEVKDLLQEVQSKAAQKEMLLAEIDAALDRRDKQAFLRATSEWKRLTSILELEGNSQQRRWR